MSIIMDAVMGDIREADGKIMREQSPGAESDIAEITTLRGGEKYVFPAPLKILTVGAVENSPFESEVIFTTTSNFTPATEVRCGLESEYDSVEVTLTPDDPTATGNARTFSAEFYNDDPDWDGYGEWRVRVYVDSTTRKWTVYTEYNGTHWAEDPETGDWDEVPYSIEGVFAVAKEADVELEFVEWVNFDYEKFPRGNYIRDGAYVKTDGGDTPPVVTIPATVGVIGVFPDFVAGKSYILNFRDNLVVGAEVRL